MFYKLLDFRTVLTYKHLYGQSNQNQASKHACKTWHLKHTNNDVYPTISAIQLKLHSKNYFWKHALLWVETGHSFSVGQKVLPKDFSVKLFAQVIQETFFYKTPFGSMFLPHKSSKQKQQFSYINSQNPDCLSVVQSCKHWKHTLK